MIEFNARFGDPETQALLARLATPLGGLLYAAATGTLADQPAAGVGRGAAVAVVLAAEGYPGTPRTGDVIGGLDADTEGSHRRPRRHRARRRRPRGQHRRPGAGRGRHRRRPAPSARRRAPYASGSPPWSSPAPSTAPTSPAATRPRTAAELSPWASPTCSPTGTPPSEMRAVWSRGEQDRRRAAAVDRRAGRAARPRRRLRRRRPGRGDRGVRAGGRPRSTWPASPSGRRSPGTTSRPGSRSSTPCAGFEHVHKGMTSRDLTENVEQLQIVSSLRLVRDRMVAALVRLAELATQYADRPIAGRSHNVAAQITTLGKRFATAADELLIAFARVEELIARYPLRGIKGPVGTGQDMLDLLGGDAAQAGRAGAAGRRPPRLRPGADQHRPGLPPLARLRRGDRAGPGGRGAVQRRHQHPADGRRTSWSPRVSGPARSAPARCRTR